MTTKRRGEFYNISRSEGDVVTKVLVQHSIQHIPYQRELTISKNSERRLKRLGGLEGWTCEPPTPYHPQVVFSVMSNA